ncbi:uncharacterized protein ARMOST_15548 [Armillaria ostoyae]|uniref:Uncharacterized protein n=1 Tax=Armillaria ostoyae TaxID=47428 RepID=A0A284RTQ2_ARMOS|nr:uncharacterized protein ARMOST_15548 [Armillaria ostoyae]
MASLTVPVPTTTGEIELLTANGRRDNSTSSPHPSRRQCEHHYPLGAVPRGIPRRVDEALMGVYPERRNGGRLDKRKAYDYSDNRAQHRIDLLRSGQILNVVDHHPFEGYELIKDRTARTDGHRDWRDLTYTRCIPRIL